MYRNSIYYTQYLVKLWFPTKIIYSHHCIHSVIRRVWRTNPFITVVIAARKVANIFKLATSLFKYRSYTIDTPT